MQERCLLRWTSFSSEFQASATSFITQQKPVDIQNTTVCDENMQKSSRGAFMCLRQAERGSKLQSESAQPDEQSTHTHSADKVCVCFTAVTSLHTLKLFVSAFKVCVCVCVFAALWGRRNWCWVFVLKLLAENQTASVSLPHESVLTVDTVIYFVLFFFIIFCRGNTFTHLGVFLFKVPYVLTCYGWWPYVHLKY